MPLCGTDRDVIEKVEFKGLDIVSDTVILLFMNPAKLSLLLITANLVLLFYPELCLYRLPMTAFPLNCTENGFRLIFFVVVKSRRVEILVASS